MKKLFALLFFLLAACSPASEPTVVVTDIEDDAPSPRAVPNVESAGAFSPAESVSEAAVVRPEDWVLGVDDPAVAIIEYGDYQ